jgi:hypothetical protein
MLRTKTPNRSLGDRKPLSCPAFLALWSSASALVKGLGGRRQLTPISVFPPCACVAREALLSSDFTCSLVGSVLIAARVPAKLSVDRTSPFQSRIGAAQYGDTTETDARELRKQQFCSRPRS